MGVMEARRRILLNQPHLVSASGNPIAFSTNFPANLAECKAAFSPVQAGTGDPSPTNIRSISGRSSCNLWRTGKNLFNPNADMPLIDCFTSDGGAQQRRGVILRLHDGTYTISAVFVNTTSTYINLNVINPDGTFDEYKRITQNQAVFTNTVTIADGKYLVIFDQQASTSTAATKFVNVNIQLELGFTATTYEPYSGATYPVTFPAVGKNLCGAELEQGTIESATGTDKANSARVRTKGYIFLKAGEYTLSAIGVGQGIFFVYDEDKTYIQSESSDGFSSLPRTITLVEDRYIRIAFRIGSHNEDVSPTDVSNVMLNSGSSAQTYEPFTNTLYGGYVDYERGEVVAEWKLISLKNRQWNTFNPKVFSTPLGNDKYTSVYTDTFPLGNMDINESILIYTGGQSYAGSLYFVKEGFNGDPSLFKSWIDNLSYDPHVCYKLSTPVTYPLTPTLIKSLKGANTIWSDMNGSLEISYWKH